MMTAGLNLKARKPEKLGEIRVEYLANHLELADELARWSWTEWRVFFDERGHGLDDLRRSYVERAQLDALPLALEAFAGDELIGTEYCGKRIVIMPVESDRRGAR